ncbi:sodium/glutamate symporter [Fusobacterium sp.]|uniref:sodium/glutamate symporter n=1 Tax=Fusobacterium sp. TaxID=68766 RepID=UPI0026314804|nr:sodium/glutamate symporter [Fusobacterium sp.]
MSNLILTDFLKSLGLLGAFLILGVFIRAKFKIFQKTFIPASIIGGFLILILGPQCLNILPVPSEWFKTYSLLPGILIIPVVASIPLGLSLNSNSNKIDNNYLKNLFPLFGIILGVSVFQFAIGYSAHLIFPNKNLYSTFGAELSIGFVGGHGTAGILSNILSDLNLPYWEIAQGVATTTATFGIVGGILIGIILINWAARNGYTQILKKPADIPESIRIGFEKDILKQNSIGRETTISSSIDTVAFHSALIFTACGLAYLLLSFIKKFKIPVLSSITVWAYAMIIMFIIWGIINKLKLSHLVDTKVKSKISSSFTEYAIISAIASLPIKAISNYIIPILVIVFLGYFFTTLILFYFCKRFLKEYWFEQMISVLGMSTGVFLTGVLLLRICDPELESPALTNYSISYTVTGIIYYALLNIFILMPLNYGIFFSILMTSFISFIFLLFSIISSRLLFGKTFKGN